jgi:hypothetical protein
MKHAVIRGPIHAQNCQCPRCRHVRGPALLQRFEPQLTWAAIAVAIVAFWAVPGRWALTLAWRAINPFLPF